MSKKIVAKFLEKVIGVAPKTLGEEMVSFTKGAKQIAGSSPRCWQSNQYFDMIQSRTYDNGISVYRGTGAKWNPLGGKYKPSGSMTAVFKNGELVAAQDDLQGTVRRYNKGNDWYNGFVRDRLGVNINRIYVDIM